MSRYYINVIQHIASDALLLFTIFLQDVDPNDKKLMVLLEGMAVEENDKLYKVTFVH